MYSLMCIYILFKVILNSRNIADYPKILMDNDSIFFSLFVKKSLMRKLTIVGTF